MKALEIAFLVAKIVGKEDLAEFLKSGTSVDISQVKKDGKKIEECLNNVLSELASSFVKIKFKERFIPSDNKVYFEDFSKCILSISRVVTDSGEEVKFKLFPSYLALYDDKPIIVEYNYLPEKVTLQDDILLGSPLISSRVLCFGVVAEYYLLSSLYEEAIIWRKKYEEAMFNALKGKKYKIKGRAFN